jgi:hypothetical protein
MVTKASTTMISASSTLADQLAIFPLRFILAPVRRAPAHAACRAAFRETGLKK